MLNYIVGQSVMQWVTGKTKKSMIRISTKAKKQDNYLEIETNIVLKSTCLPREPEIASRKKPS